MSKPWRERVWWPDDEQSKRLRLEIWKWDFVPGSYLVLTPSSVTEHPVFVCVTKFAKIKGYGSLDDKPEAEVRIVETGEVIKIRSKMMLCHVSESETKLTSFKESWILLAAGLLSLPEQTWIVLASDDESVLEPMYNYCAKDLAEAQAATLCRLYDHVFVQPPQGDRYRISL